MWKAGSIHSELSASLAAGVFGMPGGVLLFLSFYHPLHDLLKIPTEVITISMLFIFGALIWRSDTKLNIETKLNWSSILLLGHLAFHFVSNIFIAAMFNPEDVASNGLLNQLEIVMLKVQFIQYLKHWRNVNTFVLQTTMKSILIFIVFLRKDFQQMEVFGIQFVEHHLSKTLNRIWF